jgi:hypothetical protein
MCPVPDFQIWITMCPEDTTFIPGGNPENAFSFQIGRFFTTLFEPPVSFGTALHAMFDQLTFKAN